MVLGRNPRNIVVLALCSLAFLGSAQFAIDYSQRWLLIKEVESTGMDWAYHIEARLPDLLGMTNADGSIIPENVPDVDEFGHLVSDILAVGNIYQIDFINAYCFCEVSIGTYRRAAEDHGSAVAATRHRPDDSHGHEFDNQTSNAKNGVETPSSRALKHTLLNQKQHKPMAAAAAEFTLPVDRELTQFNVSGGRHNIIVRAGDTLTQPGTYSEVYHPVNSNGELLYIIRVLVDLDDKAAMFANITYSIAAAMFFLILASFGYPAIKFLVASKRHREADDRTHFLANNDVLTGIANRNAFQEIAPGVLGACATNKSTSVLLLVGINNFKEVNDFHGHHSGDPVLQEVAGMLEARTSQCSLVARLGGDEFAILMCESKFQGAPQAGAFGFPDSVQVAINGGQQNINVTLCAGLARFPRDGNDLPELMQHADLALYAAKIGPRPHMREFDPRMSRAFKQRVTLLEDFRGALQASQIVPHYQPLVDVVTGHVEGFEALARWHHPEHGVLSAALSHEAIEDHENCEMLGQLMSQKVLADMARWKAEGVRFKSVALNVGEADLLRLSFVPDIIKGMSDHSLSSGDLAIEVTERCIFGGNKETLLRRLGELRAAGCYIALDDFGTGYSSITHIKELSCTAIKIDKSFIDEVVHDDADRAIVRALFNLGRSLGFRLIAEGVETPEQRDVVERLGCHMAQGYLYSRPVPARQVPALIANLNAAQAVRMAS